MITDENKIPVAEVLSHLADTVRRMDAAGEGLDCVVLLMVNKSGGWAGAVGGEKAADLPKLLLNARDSLLRGEQTFTLFVRRDANQQNGASVPLHNGAAHAMNDDAQDEG